MNMKKSRKTAQPHHGENVDDFSQEIKNDRNSLKMKINVDMILKSINLFWDVNLVTFFRPKMRSFRRSGNMQSRETSMSTKMYSQ